MVSAGLKTVTNGWKLFEEAVEVAEAGDLPQVLHSIKGMTTPTPPPVQMDVLETGRGQDGRLCH